MFYTGLTSITFRALPYERIIELAKEAALDGIEWGGDGHVKPGLTDDARKIAEATRAAGLQVLSLGSYYRPGADDLGVGNQVLDLCAAMETKMLRVWAGRLGSMEAEGDARRTCVDALKTLCRDAASMGVTVATEYHSNTLTDNLPSTLRLMHEVGMDNFRTYWQPVVYDSAEVNARALAAVLPYAANIHVFAWTHQNGSIQRDTLEAGIDAWNRYMDVLRASNEDRALILEFVRGDDPEVFLRDAATLNRLARA
ncbi:MAG: sugar phosphate isomerase/epimerase family protein [Eubacteriales bacterium]|jgi:3-dehydroshikimate dehydratase